MLPINQETVYSLLIVPEGIDHVGTLIHIASRFISSYCSRENTSWCKHSHLLYQTIEKEVKFLHDTLYFLSIFPEELHHVAIIDTDCIKP